MATYIQQFGAQSATASGDLGEQFLAVRNDSGATQFASANLIYTPIGTNASGWVWVTGNVNATFAGNMPVLGVSAHDASASGINPIALGGYSTAFSQTTADVNLAGDLTRWGFTRGGQAFVLGGSPAVHVREWEVSAVNTNVVLAPAASNQKYVVTECGCHVGGSCSVNVSVRMGFATGNLPATASASAGAEGILLAASAIIPGGGLVRGDGVGVLGVSNDAEGIVLTTTVPTGGRAKVWATYFIVGS
jgi:hypothetical protein